MTFNKKTTNSGKDFMEKGYLTGIAFYAQVHYPQDKFNQKKYVLQLGLEGDNLVKAQKFNLNIKKATDNIPYPHVEIKRVVKGPQTQPPEVIDASNNPVDKNIKIGNGSEVKVEFSMYDNTKGKMAAYLRKVKIMKLVEWVGGMSDAQDFMAVREDGFNGVLPKVEADSDEGDDIPFEVGTKKSPVKSKVTTTG